MLQLLLLLRLVSRSTNSLQNLVPNADSLIVLYTHQDIATHLVRPVSLLAMKMMVITLLIFHLHVWQERLLQ